MKTPLQKILGPALVAGLALLLAVDASAQRLQLTDAGEPTLCTVEIRVEGQSFVRGIVGAQAAAASDQRQIAHGIDRETAPCTARQLQGVSARDIWVPVRDIAASSEGARFRVDRGRLVAAPDQTVQRQIGAGGGAGAGRVSVTVVDGYRRTDVITTRVLAVDRSIVGFDDEEDLQTIRRSGAYAEEDEEELQMIPLDDLLNAMDASPGTALVPPGATAIDMDRNWSLGSDCTLCIKSGKDSASPRLPPGSDRAER